jgi:hypothetical protein
VCNLESVLRRDALLPDTEFARRDLPQFAPDDEAGNQHKIDKWCIELHRYDLRRGQPLDFVRNSLHWLLPDTWKYEPGIAEQMIARKGWHTNADIENGVTTEDCEEDIYKRQYAESKWVDTLGRLIIAVLGGAALLVPIIIMTDRIKQKWRLVTVGVAVAIFGLVLSIGTRATNQEILGASAAYAAVMVVYIGTAS